MLYKIHDWPNKPWKCDAVIKVRDPSPCSTLHMVFGLHQWLIPTQTHINSRKLHHTKRDVQYNRGLGYKATHVWTLLLHFAFWFVNFGVGNKCSCMIVFLLAICSLLRLKGNWWCSAYDGVHQKPYRYCFFRGEWTAKNVGLGTNSCKQVFY